MNKTNLLKLSLVAFFSLLAPSFILPTIFPSQIINLITDVIILLDDDNVRSEVQNIVTLRNLKKNKYFTDTKQKRPFSCAYGAFTLYSSNLSWARITPSISTPIRTESISETKPYNCRDGSEI